MYTKTESKSKLLGRFLKLISENAHLVSHLLFFSEVGESTRTMPIVRVSHFEDSDDDDNRPAKRRKLNEECQLHVGYPGSKESTTESMPSSTQQTVKPNLVHLISRQFRKEMVLDKMLEMHPERIAIEMQKMIEFCSPSRQHAKCNTFGPPVAKCSMRFLFEPHHFVKLIEERLVDPIRQNAQSGSLDILRNFLVNRYQFVNGLAERCAQCGQYRVGHRDEHNAFYCDKCWDSYRNQMETSKMKPNADASKGKGNDKQVLRAYAKSPKILIISPTVRKAIATIKSVSDLKVKQKRSRTVRGIQVAKLFGKKMKIQDQQSALSVNKWHCGVGNIDRLFKLCESEHLSLKNTTYLMIDLQKDAKKLNLLEIRATFQQMGQFLITYAAPHLESRRLKIVFF